MTANLPQTHLVNFDNVSYILDKLTLCYTDPNSENVKATRGLLLSDHHTKSIPGMVVTANARYEVSTRIPLPLKTDGSKQVVVFEAAPRDPKTASYRLEFNPAKLSSEGLDDLFVFLSTILDEDPVAFFQMSRVTRLDIALDLHGLSLADVIVRSARLQKHGLYSNRHGNPETVYLGTPKSRRVVAYDKPSKEMSTTHLRVECRLKPQCFGIQIATLDNPFKKIELISADIFADVGLGIPAQFIADSFRIGGLKRALLPLNKSQRKLLKNAFVNAPSILPSPDKSWEAWPETLIKLGLGKELGAIPTMLFKAA